MQRVKLRPTKPVTLTQPSKEALHGALVHGFNRSGFKAMISLELGQKPDRLMSEGTLDEQVLEVIEWAENRGRVSDLLSGASNAHPENRDLAELSLEYEALPLGARFTRYFRDPARLARSIIGVVAFASSLVGLLQACESDNRPPFLTELPTVSVRAGDAVEIDLLAGATDDDGVDKLQVRLVSPRSAQGGTVAILPNGRASYDAPDGYRGDDEFGYTVVDGDGAAAGGVQTITVEQGSIVGSPAVAVAALSAEGSDAEVDDLAEEASTKIGDQVRRAFERSLLVDRFGFAGPEAMGPLTGDSQGRADEVDADVLVYGVLTSDGESSVVELRFYLSPEEITNAREVANDYPLVAVEAGVSGGGVLLGAIDSKLPASLDVLTGFLVGVDLFNQQEWEEAESHLLAAAAQWPLGRESSNGKEAVLMLLGNVHLELMEFGDAQESYAQALAVAENDARPRFGLAEASFLLARGPKCGSGDPEDLDALEAVRLEFEDLIDVDEPAPFTGPRAQVEAGRTALCLHLYEVDRLEGYSGERLDMAHDAFTAVIEEHRDTASLREIIAETYQRLAVVHELRSEWVDAAAALDAALDKLRGDDLKAGRWHYQLAGILRCELGDPPETAFHYAESRRLLAEDRPEHEC